MGASLKPVILDELRLGKGYPFFSSGSLAINRSEEEVASCRANLILVPALLHCTALIEKSNLLKY